MIRVERHGAGGAVAVITIDRTDKRNALTPDMARSLADCAGRLRESGARAAVLAGAGATFCAGFDLSICKADTLATADLLRSLAAAVRALRRLPVPVVAAAQGAAIAGGCALVSACDIVVTDRAAKFGYPVVRIGLSPAVSAPTVLMALAAGRTRERMLDPGLITGEEAFRIGLAHECLDAPEAVTPRALAIADSLAAKPAHSLATTKLWLNELDGSDDDATLDAALRASLSLTGGAEERERLLALPL